MVETQPRPVAVVGAGIVGASIAFELQRRGKRVLLIERDEPGKGASFGNMASIAVTEFLPSSRPSVWAQIPGWMLNPEGPVSVRPLSIPRLLPWFWRFMLASRPSTVAALGAAGAALCHRALGDMETLLAAAGLSDMLSSAGCLCLYGSAKERVADRDHLALLETHGFATQSLSAAEVRDLEPALSGPLEGALLLPDNKSVSSPHGLVAALVERVRAMGGAVLTGSVEGLSSGADGVDAVCLSDGQRLAVSDVVLCAGVHTRMLARKMGEPIPLETERGYHTQIMAPGISMAHSLIWPARAFMVTPTAGGIRVGGTVEMAGLDTPPNYRRAQVLVRHAQEVLPGLQRAEATEWMGHRPAFPDTIPVISRSARHRKLFYATGHGHLGLTNSAVTARLIAAMVCDMPPVLDLAPYRIDRF